MRHNYGTGPDQYGELFLPPGERRPGVVVVIHGGFWRAIYDASLGRPLASSLAERGRVAWNIEYRRVGNGGGWSTTFQDVADAIDHLGALDVDPSPVVAVGHSAGGHLATWAAGRTCLPASSPGSSPRVPVTAVVSQAGVLDLGTAQPRTSVARPSSTFLEGLRARCPSATPWPTRSCRYRCRFLSCAFTVAATAQYPSPRAEPTWRQPARPGPKSNWWRSGAATWHTSIRIRKRGPRCWTSYPG